ncbi:MAG: transposase [Verrucomicrobiaceae bacterium]
MPRQPRLQHPGAHYHVMARGNRREAIFRDDADRRFFLHALGQACERTGWEVLAWVLLDNHYHLVLHTPEANLVAGMKWLQNAYTRRFNVRHRLWGHLFGGRYKSIIVEDGEYLKSVVDYVHLNPVRARLVTTREGLESYAWSSLPGMLAAPRKRTHWLAAARALELVQLPDTPAGRRRYVERLEEVVDWQKRGGAGLRQSEGGSLNRSLRHGWCYGSEEFREKLLRLAGKSTSSNANYRGSPLGREHGERAAEQLLKAGLKSYELNLESMRSSRGGDPRKQEMAWVLARHTTVTQAWIAARLGMGSASHVSHQAARHEKKTGGKSKAVERPKWMP